MSSSTSRTKKRKESKHPQWSEWEWVEEYNCLGRYRQNNKQEGGYEWDYKPVEDDNTSAQNARDVPRYQGTDNGSYSPPEADGGVPIPVASQASSSPSDSSYTYRSQSSVDPIEGLSRDLENTSLSGRKLDKGKQPEGSTSAWRPNPNSPSFSRGHSQTALTYPQYPQAAQNNQDYYQGSAALGHIQENAQISGAEPFSGQYPGQYQGFATNPYSGNPYNQYPTSDASSDPSRIAADENNFDELYPEYKQRYSKEFKPFKVFMTLFHETRGENHTLGTDIIKGRYGQAVNGSIRRFLIVKVDRGHCLCLPILTYNRQGTKKPGLIASHHGQIYTGSRPPKLLSGEAPLEKKAIRMIPRESHRLHEASRINYAKIYTLEHNVKCVFIGKIDERDQQKVMAEYNQTLKI